MMQPVNKETVEYFSAVSSAAYFQSVWESLHQVLNSDQLGRLHKQARAQVERDLNEANRCYR